MVSEPTPVSGATDTDGGRGARSLADWLRARPDDDLVTLLTARPELVHPVPPDLAVLSARATSTPSVLAALDRLDTFTLEVVDALAVLPDPTTYADVCSVIDPAAAAAVRTAIDRLRELALVWGDDGALHLIRAVRESTQDPAGLGPPMTQALAGTSFGRLRDLLSDLDLPGAPDRHTAVETLAAWAGDQAAVRHVLDGADPAAREALERLAWGPPLGTVTDAQRADRRASATTPIRWLLAHALIVAVDDRVVVLPREIALVVRGGHLHAQVHPDPPTPVTTAVPADRVTHAAVEAARRAVRAVERLLDLWAAEPPAALRAGGVSVRDVRRTATRLELTDHELATFTETAYAAGLLARADNYWLPTSPYDAWRQLDDAHRWARLAGAWLTMSRVPMLAASGGDDRPLALLSPELDRTIAAPVRADVLAELAGAGANVTIDPDDVCAVLRWRRPRRGGPFRDELVRATFAEAELLGVTGAHCLTDAGRLLVCRDDRATAAMAAAFPPPIDHILIQADLTAVAPGPLTRTLESELALLAEVESTGHATVYRFTESSLRRALDAGRTADDVHMLLAQASRTPVPQPLTYLVDDLARRHGRVRVGTASAYVRCDDPAVLAEILAARGASGLRLRRLAPTVLAAEAAPDRVLSVLREIGHAPAAETSTGDVVLARPGARRAHSSAPPMPVTEPRAPAHDLLVAAVRALRAGDHAATAVRRPVTVPEPPSGVLPSTPSARTLVALQEAAGDGRSLWIGYVNAQGRASQRVVEPISVDGGYLRAFDHLRDEVRTFALHRITGIAELVNEEAQ